MRKLLARLAARRGNAMVELGLVLPALTGAVIFIGDVGAAAYKNMTLKSAVRAGADYAVRYGDLAGVKATIAAAANRDINAISVDMTEFCGCSTTVVTCGGSCYGGAQQVYKRISVTETYSPMFVSQSMVSTVLGQGSAMRAEATFRTK